MTMLWRHVLPICMAACIAGTIFLCGGCSGSSGKPGQASVPAQLASTGSEQRLASGPAGRADAESVAEVQGGNASLREAAVAERTGTAAEQLGRQWRGPDGQVIAVGNFVDLVDDQVCLETPQGLGLTIPLAALCEEDRLFVHSQLAGHKGADLQGAEVLALQNPDIIFDDEVLVDEVEAATQTGDQASTAQAITETSPADPRKFVIPFDFVSRFDGGRYGQMVAEMIWKKLQREGGFLLPGSMLEVRDFCASHHIELTPETPLEEVGKVVRELFDGDIAIWGSVERVPGAMWDEYDLVIKCVDFSGEKPDVLFDVAARTKTVSEIPHLYAEQLLDKLYDRQPVGPRAPDPIAEENWAKNPNLVRGDFEQGSGGVPIGWERGGGQHREPLGRLVKWIPEPGNPTNKIIRFEFSADVGDTYGVMYYSEPFPVEEGATYRFQCRWRSNGPAVKVFIKCYDLFESEYQPATAVDQRRSGGYTPQEKQLREVYRSQQNLKGPLNQWNVHTEDFTPRHTKYTPRWGKVMLYAYLGAGIVDFDDVVVKQILPPSPGEQKRELRHSLASPVTVKEMEENIRRTEEARQKGRSGGR